MGASHAAGSTLENQIANINLTLSNLAGDIRKNLASINSITEILENASLHSHIDDEGDGNNTNNENESKLDEISNILLDIGNAMSLDFANRIAENKEDIGDLKKQKSKGKFGRAESGIEKQKKEKAGNIFTKTADKASSPLSGIFGKLLQLGGILGTGILTNVAFDWFKDEENQKKISKFFKIFAKNWKWVVGTIGVLVGAKIILDLAILIKGLGSIVALGSLLFGAGALGGGAAAASKTKVTTGSGSAMARKSLLTGLFGKLLIAAGLYRASTLLPEGGQGLGKDEREVLKRLEDMGGATNENRNKLIEQLEEQLKYMPFGSLGALTGKRADIEAEIKFLRDGTIPGDVKKIKSKYSFDEMKIVPISKKTDINKISKKSGMNFIPINLPTITKTPPQLPALSSVATNVLHISSKNVSDPYRQLTPDIYGIYV